jgi:shikimate dehydrogenase
VLTRVGLIGNPVAHSLSPRMQNAAFAAAGLDWEYVLLPTEDDEVEDTVRALIGDGFAGANVTVPHKAAVLGFLDDVDSFAERAGSVNTIVVAEGRLLGSSTDGLAVTGAISAAGARVLLLGAGGAARAIATALADEGASLRISARRRAQAEALAARVGAAVSDWPPALDGAAAVVNATPIRDEALVDLAAGPTVVDLAYRPDGEPTALVAAARAAGCTVVDGLEVLVRQGAASFERWTGVEPPLDVMRAAIRGAI